MNSGLAMIVLIIFIGMVAGKVYVDSREMRAQEQTYIMREEKLQREIAEEQNRTEVLKERKKEVTTPRYIKEVAKEKLGLAEPGEIFLKARED